MKVWKVYLLIVLNLLISGPINAYCPPGDLIFTSQHQIEEWAARHPDCTEISGNVMIGKRIGLSDIRDLSPLERITSIDGYLNILNNPLLTTLNGLDHITSIDGYLNLFNNDGLTTLDGLSNLTSVNGFLWIIHNEVLYSLRGLEHLTSINGSLELTRNPSLNSLEGLQNIDPASFRTNLSYHLTSVIDIKIIENGRGSLELPSNVIAYQEQNSLVNRFRRIMDQPYADRAVESDMVFKGIEVIDDSVRAYSILREISRLANQTGEALNRWETELLFAYYDLINGSEPLAQRIGRMQALADRAGRVGVWQIQGRALKNVAISYWYDLQNYDKTFETYHELEQVLEKMSPSEFPDMVQCYLMIGEAHYRFRDYRKAIHYFKKGAAIPKTDFNATFVTHCINDLGLCYQKLNPSDTSDFYFNQLLADTIHTVIPVWEGIASGNLGYNYYLRKQFDEALPLLHKDILVAESLKFPGLAAGSLIPLADISVVRNQLDQAEDYILRAREYIYLSGETDRLRLLFPVISKWHAAKGHKNRAADYVDSTLLAMKAYDEKFNALKVLRAQQEVSAKELQLKELERQKIIQQRNLIIVIVLVLFVLGITYIWYRMKDVRRRREIRELALANAQESLEHAQDRLGSLTRKIRENNQLIHQLRQENGQNLDPEVLKTLQNATILTKEDWMHFKKHFQKAYPGFIHLLISRYPDLTTGELRCLCLEKLELSNLEMASAQGVSPKSVNVTQHRIRKKLGLDSQTELEQLVKNLH